MLIFGNLRQDFYNFGHRILLLYLYHNFFLDRQKSNVVFFQSSMKANSKLAEAGSSFGKTFHRLVLPCIFILLVLRFVDQNLSTRLGDPLTEVLVVFDSNII